MKFWYNLLYQNSAAGVWYASLVLCCFLDVNFEKDDCFLVRSLSYEKLLNSNIHVLVKREHSNKYENYQETNLYKGRAIYYLAHVEKYHVGAIGNLCRHFERAKDKDGNYIKFRNQNIDLTLTASNYNLASSLQPLQQKEFIRKRLSEVKVLKRADVKVMCDWVVTLPKSMELEERKFFGKTFNFLSNRYGQENVISAYVHRDETQPHLHFAFIPVTMDKKKNIPKVSAKEVLTRVELQRFHGDLDAYLESVFGKSIGVLNGATRDGNKSIDELKRGTAVKELNALLQKRQAEEKRIDALKWGDRIVPVKEKGSTVVISKSDFESANDALVKKYSLEERTKESEEKAAKAVNRDYQKELSKYWTENRELKTQHYILVAKKNKLSRELADTQKVFNRYPNFWQEFLRLAKELERIDELENRIIQSEKRALKQLEKAEDEL